MSFIFDEKLILLILQSVNANGNVEKIISSEVDFSMVYSYLSHIKKNGLISDLSGTLKIEKLGQMKIDELNTKLGRLHSERWISPQYQYLIDKWKSSDIYLP